VNFAVAGIDIACICEGDAVVASNVYVVPDLQLDSDAGACKTLILLDAGLAVERRVAAVDKSTENEIPVGLVVHILRREFESAQEG